MSKNLMSTEKGGEQTQYEGAYTEQVPHKKSGGQMGAAETTTDPQQTEEAAQQHAAQGEKKAENIRYGQTISEGGMSGFTEGHSGEANQGGFGRTKDASDEGASTGAGESRRAAGYGGSEDQNREIGA